MSELCHNGGKDAIEKFSSSQSNTKLGVDVTKEGLQEYISLLKRILNECPDYDDLVDDAYYFSRIMMVYYFSKDSTTGNICMTQIGATHNIQEDTYDAGLFRIPYNEWKSNHCESSCVSELDPIYREYAKSSACDTSKDYAKEAFEFRRACEIFKTTGNPICGNKIFPEVNKQSSTIDNSDNDFCAEGGSKALSEYLKVRPNFKSIDTVKKEELQDLITYVKKILTECPNHEEEFEEMYYISRILLVLHFSQDKSTGNNCLIQLGATRNTQNNSYDMGIYRRPYSEWDNLQQCESSCVAELDVVYREFSTSVACDSAKKENSTVQFGNICELFKNNGNPTCGSINYAKIYEENKNDAMTLTTTTGPLLFFSLMLYILFNIFK